MITKTFKLLVLASLLCFAILSSQAALAWDQPPAGTPPDCSTTPGAANYREGCNPPINAGSVTQNKPGKLQLGVLYLNEGFIPSGTPTTTLSNTFASLVSGYGYLNIFGRGTPANRTVKIWENLIVPGNVYATNYYICPVGGSCTTFNGGVSYWTKNGEGEIITPYKVGISGANPSSGLDLAIGDPNIGFKVSTSTGLFSIYNGISRLNISSTGAISVPESKAIGLGTGVLTGFPTTLEIKGVGPTGSRKVTILDKVFTNEICTISGVCNSVSNVINGVDKIVAGSGIAISPADGKGTVIISSTGPTGSSYWAQNGANIYNTNTGGNVGIGTNAPGNFKLAVTGAGAFSDGVALGGESVVSGNKTLQFGNATDNQGKIGMKAFSPNSLDIVGSGSLGSRMIKLWDSVTVPGSICSGEGSCSLVEDIINSVSFWVKSSGTNNISTISNIGVNGARPSASGLNIAVADNVGLKYDSGTGELQLFNAIKRLGVGSTGAINIPAGKPLCLGTDCRSAWPTTAASGVTQIKAGTNVTVSPTEGTGVVTISANIPTVGSSIRSCYYRRSASGQPLILDTGLSIGGGAGCSFLGDTQLVIVSCPTGYTAISGGAQCDIASGVAGVLSTSVPNYSNGWASMCGNPKSWNVTDNIGPTIPVYSAHVVCVK